MKTEVGQVFLTHPKDQNYTVLYEEAFSKSGETIELFLVLEIDGFNGPLTRSQHAECEKLAQTIVSVFKKTYVTAPKIDSETFEKALASINSSLARLASKEKVSWYNKLHAALGSLRGSEFSLSTTGNAEILLARREELTVLSEDLAENRKPVKIFSNYSTGRLASQDRVIFTTNQLFNYLSLERLKEFLEEDTVEGTCREIISALTDLKETGFATFVFEINPPVTVSKSTPVFQPKSPEKEEKEKSAWIYALISGARLIGSLTVSILQILWNIILSALNLLFSLFRGRGRAYAARKKYLVAAAVLLVLILIVNVAAGFIRKSITERRQEKEQEFNFLEEKINQAEASLIYSDEKQVLTIIQEIEERINNLDQAKRQELDGRLAQLKNKISKKEIIESPTILTQFGNIPTDLIRSPNGIIGFNRSSGTLSFYNFLSGETKPILKDQNTSHLILGAWVGGNHGFVFLTQDGEFEKLNLSAESFAKFEQGGEFDLKNSEIADFEVLGEGNSARIYLLDKEANQIWRFPVQEGGPAAAEQWLKSDANLSGGRDMSIDNNIYVAFPDRIEKYFNGKKESFEISPLLPALNEMVKVFTRPDYQFLYLLDPGNERILILDKQGKLERQLVSSAFREMSDIWVDEKSGISYLLSGPELLQVTLP